MVTTTSTATTAGGWFGTLLDWTPDRAGSRVGWHAGRSYRLTRVGRDWCFARHPDLAVDERAEQPIGPALARALAAATTRAEVWILTPESDHWPATDAPSVLLATVPGAGASFDAADGTPLTAQAEPDRGCVVIRADGDTNDCAQVWPVYDGQRLRWQAVVGTRALPAVDTWHAAARTVGATLTGHAPCDP